MQKNYVTPHFEFVESTFLESSKIHTAAKYEVLQCENKQAEYLFFITEGVVREHLLFNDGRDVNIFFWPSPALVSCLRTCKVEANALTSLSMLTTGKYIKIPMKKFDEKISQKKNGKYWMNNILETQNHWLKNRFLLLSHKSAEERVREFASTFPALYKSIPDYHIASYLGITPVTMHRAKSKLTTLEMLSEG